ncbi:DUF433 domain-containing protein [Gloeobacter morelensis]|uniref:DUF433 domain-containing protein n=1 Tax=Gloeobacter morelensis MG652769 TaxID=2781736 RepID=A0ABY3PKE5_9CYAN|nr:DUF433 domain-containing protein [Gloeobacter morelensis]UFP94108.1 DUF433 domain-containing protein [Gloeobacter morelensis MG652769]
MSLKELQPQLLALSPEEKAQAIELLAQSLSNVWRGVAKIPGVVGGDACVAGTRIPVWGLVNYRRLGADDARILAAFPQLTAADLQNAWAYAQAFPDEIEIAIRDNENA